MYGCGLSKGMMNGGLGAAVALAVLGRRCLGAKVYVSEIARGGGMEKKPKRGLVERERDSEKKRSRFWVRVSELRRGIRNWVKFRVLFRIGKYQLKTMEQNSERTQISVP